MVGPDDALVVVALFDGGTCDTRDADAVATHFKNLRLAVFIEIGRLHGFGILCAEIEDMTDFNAALKTNLPFAVRALVALDNIAQVGHFGFGQVAAEVDPCVVETGFVGAAAEIAHVGNRAVGVDHDIFSDADGSERSRVGTVKMSANFFLRGKTKSAFHFRQFTGLDFV